MRFLGLIFLSGLLSSTGAMGSESRCADSIRSYNNCLKSPFFGANSSHCKKQLIQDYAANLFHPLNRHLRGVEADPTCEPIIAPLIWAMSRLKVSTAGTYYRGVRSFPALERLRVHDCMVDQGFVSTSLLEERAKGFTDENNSVILQIKATSGHEILSRVGYKHEREVIFLPGSVFQLVALRRSSTQSLEIKDTTRVETRYFFEEVPLSECASINP